MKKLFQLFRKNEGDKISTPKKMNYIIILGLIGLLLIIFSNIFSTSEESAEDNNEILQESLNEPNEETAGTKTNHPDQASFEEELEAGFEQELEKMLNKIQGVSEAEVMVNLDSTNVHVYEKNLIKGSQTTEESDQHGGDRTVEDQTEESQVVLVRQGDREVPLLVQTKKPEVRGVFVIAKGADQKTVENWIVESVSRVLDVPTHRISVMPKN